MGPRRIWKWARALRSNQFMAMIRDRDAGKNDEHVNQRPELIAGLAGSYRAAEIGHESRSSAVHLAEHDVERADHRDHVGDELPRTMTSSA